MFRGSLLVFVVLLTCFAWLADASVEQAGNFLPAPGDRTPTSSNSAGQPVVGTATIEPSQSSTLEIRTADVEDSSPEDPLASEHAPEAQHSAVCQFHEAPEQLLNLLAGFDLFALNPASEAPEKGEVAEKATSTAQPEPSPPAAVDPEAIQIESAQADPHQAVSTLADQPVVEPRSDVKAANQPAEPAVADVAGTESADHDVPAELVVHTDYQKAMKEAAEDRKMLFIYFHERRPTAAQRAFEKETLADIEIQEKLKRYVFVRLPRDAEITVDGRRVVLLKHAAFAEMLGRQGVAVIDLAHLRAEYYGHVVSAFPFTPGKYYRKQALSIILDLPSGTLTQRTMIYAVRIHPERPASTQGQFHNVLADEAKRHANHQAAILVQGHHSWDSRFHRINARLPSGVMAQEVVAESWPNESLVEACIDCVHSWRQSPGHWGAVRSRQALFGYDIKRGRNGIWYATGIFGRR